VRPPNLRSRGLEPLRRLGDGGTPQKACIPSNGAHFTSCRPTITGCQGLIEDESQSIAGLYLEMCSPGAKWDWGALWSRIYAKHCTSCPRIM
jgi:hypothetical protein